jgi:hypothetical protein
VVGTFYSSDWKYSDESVSRSIAQGSLYVVLGVNITMHSEVKFFIGEPNLSVRDRVMFQG